MSIQPVGSGTWIDAQNPWPGLSAFDEETQRFFNGRDDEAAELFRLVGQAPLTVLFGKSGLGKTSLLNAGLFPRARRQNFLPVYVRLDVRDRSAPLIQQAAAALQAEILEHGVDATKPQAGESLWDYLHGRNVQWWSRKNQPLTPLFVFDQFEEVFTLGAENVQAIDRLQLDLADLVENRIPLDLANRIDSGASTEQLDLRAQRYKVLLSFREDFLPEVEGLKGELPSLMRNRLRLLPMSAERALQVVTGRTPEGRTHDLVAEETGRKIVGFVAAVQTGDEGIGRSKNSHKAADSPWENLQIEPALLSLVCQGLNEKRKVRRQAAIDAALLDETGTTIIADFYQSCVEKVPAKSRRFIEDALITEGGFRNSFPLQEALDHGLLTEPLLRQLVDRRLLRIDHQLGVNRVELIHDRLTDVVREHRDRERLRAARVATRKKQIFLASTLAVAALATSLSFIAWQKVWTNLATVHLARAEMSSNFKERLSESVAGLRASKLSMGVDSSYPRQVANDAIGAVIGEHARRGTLGKLPAYPSVPDIECDHVLLFSGGDSYSVYITSDFAPPARLDGLETCPIFAANPDGTLLAAAWEKGSGVNIKVFRLSPNFHLGSGTDGRVTEADLKEDDAPWMKMQPLLAQLLREGSKKRGEALCKDRSLRFSQDDRIVSFECLYSGDSGNELKWMPLALEGTSSDPTSRVSANTFEAVQKVTESQKAASVFLGSLGFVTVRGDGSVRIWREGKDQPSAEFRSDFVRVATWGRPTALDVQDADDNLIYAIYSLNPYPTIRVYEQRSASHTTLLLEHYPPNGVGTPVGIKFTTSGRCLKIRAKRRKAAHELELVDYYLVLDPNRLLAVGKALSMDLEREPTTLGFPKYKEAIQKQCGA